MRIWNGRVHSEDHVIFSIMPTRGSMRQRLPETSGDYWTIKIFFLNIRELSDVTVRIGCCKRLTRFQLQVLRAARVTKKTYGPRHRRRFFDSIHRLLLHWYPETIRVTQPRIASRTTCAGQDTQYWIYSLATEQVQYTVAEGNLYCTEGTQEFPYFPRCAHVSSDSTAYVRVSSSSLRALAQAMHITWAILKNHSALLLEL